MIDTQKETYDRVISLGMDCRPKVAMDIAELNGRRTPFDVMGTQSIQGLVGVLERKLKDFFLLENLNVLPHSDRVFKRVFDTRTGYISIHDFDPLADNIAQEYPVFRERLDRHIQNFLTDVRCCHRVLFVLNLEMAPSEREYTDDVETLRQNLPVVRELLDKLCGHQNSQLLVATFHESLLSISLPRTKIVLKQDFTPDTPFMKGPDLEQWLGWLEGISVERESCSESTSSGYSLAIKPR